MKSIIKIDGYDYELYRKVRKLDGVTNYMHVNYGKCWYKLKDNFSTILLGDELYTSKFYKTHIQL